MTQERLFPEAPTSEVPIGEPTPASPIRPATRRDQARLYKPVRNQVEMMLRDLDSLLPEDHLARAVWAFVERLDLSAFYAPIEAIVGEPGHPATDPQVLVALWVYATADGIGKARQLDRLCHEHDAYRWLRGGVPINYHMLSDFRVEHGQALNDLLSEVLAAMMAEGLVNPDRVSQDGLRVRASAGASSFRREERLKSFLEQAQERVKCLAEVSQAEREADPEQPAEGVLAERASRREQAARERAARERQERIERALAELPAVRAAKKTEEKKEQARVSTTDPEARVMKMADGGFRPAYNVQFATTTDKQVIVGVSVTNRGSEGDEAPPMQEQVTSRTEQTPKDYLIDGGQATLRTIDKLNEAGLTVYAPTQAPRGTKRSQDEPRPSDSPAVAAWRTRMATEEAKAIYKERAATSECVNARARQHGLYQFVVRGLSKVTCVALWLAITHDLLRWIALTSQSTG
jgi:transposase